METESILFFDTEVTSDGSKLLDIGAVKDDKTELHTTNRGMFTSFAAGCAFMCGHNIFSHDLKYVQADLKAAGQEHDFIDTLFLSPLLFPNRPYHHLLKNDKLQTEELNNPLNDAKKARDLFYDEVTAFNRLPAHLQAIYCSLLSKRPEFASFFKFVHAQGEPNLVTLIRFSFNGKICAHADIADLIESYPVELAYCLALINTDDKYSIIPPWVSFNFPDVDMVMDFLRNIPCDDGCEYCRSKLDIHKNLKRIFNYDSFRTYNGEPLQEQAAQAAVNGSSLLAIFPTGGGKSLTFQLPALMSGETVRGLTVVISPLQSLMKDQVDNLEQKFNITEAATINGLLDPIQRKKAIDRVANGDVSILYISPESLRSATIEKLLLSRNVVRFVVDEAHCFSAWGQDFRVDYLYIGDFIRQLQEKKGLTNPIPVSCFTATAKQKVISDIREYFRKTLNLELTLFSTNADRENLHYEVLFREKDEDKYTTLRSLIQAKHCPTIVYVSRTKRTERLADRLTKDGFYALPFNGKMDSADKVKNQDAFMRGSANGGTDIIVATSAFGMGVDKDNVGLVIHYDISDSLENYVQEAGRAGRNQSINADCYVLFNDEDLDKHFSLLSQTKLSMSEINQVWRAVKNLTKQRRQFTRTPLEIARAAGWDDNIADVETRVKTAIAALEHAGYVKRGRNVPRIYATGIIPTNAAEAGRMIDSFSDMDQSEKLHAHRVMDFLISRRSHAKAKTDDAESRIDYIADRLGLPSEKVIDLVTKLRDVGVLADSEDMTAHIGESDTQKKASDLLTKIDAVEDYLIDHLPESGSIFYKEINDDALHAGVRTATVKDIKTVIVYWLINGYLDKSLAGAGQQLVYRRTVSAGEQHIQHERILDLSRFIVDYLYKKKGTVKEGNEVPFSVLAIRNAYNDRDTLFDKEFVASTQDVKDALLYLNKINAIELDGGFLVFYSAIQVERIAAGGNTQYKKEDYKQLSDFYAQRIQQIHIVGEYAHLMTKNKDDARMFVRDYFELDYSLFRRKYFKGDRAAQINRNITPGKYDKLFGDLSPMQREIIDDDASKYIVVAAGPGSGKTKVLVHKLASLLLLEDVKSEQLLMLTFSRSAATEFKKRLYELIGDSAFYVEIKTFHSYCFDLLGQIGTLEESKDIVKRAAEMIEAEEVDIGRITKTVLVLDEAQDMDPDAFNLVKAIMKRNEDMRVIAVGDDDQNIYEFNNADSGHMRSLVTDYGARQYELLDNYRSDRSIVAFANAFASTIKNRMKSHPINPVSSNDGVTGLCKFSTPNMEMATFNLLRRTYKGGTCGVLTRTNDEALRMVGLLKKNGYRARLIQSNDGFNLYNLYEMRTFVGMLGDADKMPVIPQDVWDATVSRFQRRFQKSECLTECLTLLHTFDKTTPNKYMSDLVEFISESKFEDFISTGGDEILVSTVHKSKGREFDYVYLMLNRYLIQNDADRRVFYVGFTRAKRNLFVCYNNSAFDRFAVPGCQHYADPNPYPECDELIEQLSHKGVFLGYFQDKQQRIVQMYSGAPLTMDGDYLRYDFGSYKAPVLRFSNRTRTDFAKHYSDGYSPLSAKVRFLVYWKPADDPDAEETLIILPEVKFKRNQQ